MSSAQRAFRSMTEKDLIVQVSLPLSKLGYMIDSCSMTKDEKQSLIDNIGKKVQAILEEKWTSS